MLWYAVCSVRPQTGCGHMPFWAFENFFSSSSWTFFWLLSTSEMKFPYDRCNHSQKKKKNETKKCRRRPQKKPRPNIWRRFKVNSNESTFTSATLTRARARSQDAIYYCQNQIKTINPCRYSLLFINCHRIDSIIDAHTHRVILTVKTHTPTQARSLVSGGFIDPKSCGWCETLNIEYANSLICQTIYYRQVFFAFFFSLALLSTDLCRSKARVRDRHHQNDTNTLAT